jgi:hypothetical protein
MYKKQQSCKCELFTPVLHKQVKHYETNQALSPSQEAAEPGATTGHINAI